jgi:hypothetical protein
VRDAPGAGLGEQPCVGHPSSSPAALASMSGENGAPVSWMPRARRRGSRDGAALRVWRCLDVRAGRVSIATSLHGGPVRSCVVAHIGAAFQECGLACLRQGSPCRRQVPPAEGAGSVKVGPTGPAAGGPEGATLTGSDPGATPVPRTARLMPAVTAGITAPALSLAALITPRASGPADAPRRRLCPQRSRVGASRPRG